MRDAIRVGLALFNDGWYHAAHDAWESTWLELETGSADERFLHGLIQFTAAVYHVQEDNPQGAAGLAESAQEYLADLPGTYRGVDLASVRGVLTAIRTGGTIDPTAARPVTHEGEPVGLAALTDEETWQAALIVAEEVEGAEVDVLEGAIELAAVEAPGGRFRRLVGDFVAAHDRRPVVYKRLAQHLARERRRQDEVKGLFDEEA